MTRVETNTYDISLCLLVLRLKLITYSVLGVANRQKQIRVRAGKKLNAMGRHHVSEIVSQKQGNRKNELIQVEYGFEIIMYLVGKNVIGTVNYLVNEILANISMNPIRKIC